MFWNMWIGYISLKVINEVVLSVQEGLILFYNFIVVSMSFVHLMKPIFLSIRGAIFEQIFIKRILLKLYQIFDIFLLT